MIRVDVLSDLSSLDTLDSFLEAFPGLLADTVTTVFQAKIEPGLLSELRYTPGKVKYPIQWASEKQRRWYFANAAQIPYQRTGNMVAAWKAGVTVGDDAVAMFVENKSKALKYVTGKRQQPFHANTGWPRHEETIGFWAQVAQEEVGSALDGLCR